MAKKGAIETDNLDYIVNDHLLSCKSFDKIRVLVRSEGEYTDSQIKESIARCKERWKENYKQRQDILIETRTAQLEEYISDCKDRKDYKNLATLYKILVSIEGLNQKGDISSALNNIQEFIAEYGQ